MERTYEQEGRGEYCKRLSSGHSTGAALMNSQQLELPVQDHQNKPVNNAAWMEEGLLCLYHYWQVRMMAVRVGEGESFFSESMASIRLSMLLWMDGPTPICMWESTNLTFFFFKKEKKQDVKKEGTGWFLIGAGLC